MATQTSTLNSLRHLYAVAEVARLKYKADIEVGAEPKSWRTEAP